MATILVVDDELGIRDLLSEILNDEGHAVELAEKPGPTLLDRLLGPFAEMQGGEARRVGMTEADDRTPGPLTGRQGPLPRRIGIAGLDD